MPKLQISLMANSNQTLRSDISHPCEGRTSRPPASCRGTEIRGARVLIFRGKDKALASLSPFHRRNGCDRLGQIIRCDKLRDGSLEVEFVKSEEAEKALTATTFAYSVRNGTETRDVVVNMTVEPHKMKNLSKGIINCYDLRDVADEEIVDGLSEFGVTDARRMMVRREGRLCPTNNIVLTFNRPDLPADVAVGYLRVKVRPFIPNPMRCYQCQRFGHTKPYCKNPPVCGVCASTEHLADACEGHAPRCANCGPTQSPHASFDRTCPVYIREKEILTIKCSRKVSFREAREIYSATHPKSSYAAKVKTAVPATQSEVMTLPQLVNILKHYGLAVVPAPSAPATSLGSPTPPAPATSVVSTAPDVPSAGGSGWTVVRRGRGPRSSPARSGSPPGPVASPASAPPTPPRAAASRRSPVTAPSGAQLSGGASRPGAPRSTGVTVRPGAPDLGAAGRAARGVGPTVAPARAHPSPSGDGAAMGPPPAPARGGSASSSPAAGRTTKRPPPWPVSPTDGGRAKVRGSSAEGRPVTGGL